MTIFGDYARYYDVLYQDKDYAGEADFVLSCLVRRQGEPRTLLDLGCGTGRHGLEMARRGVSVTGVDMFRHHAGNGPSGAGRRAGSAARRDAAPPAGRRCADRSARCAV